MRILLIIGALSMVVGCLALVGLAGTAAQQTAARALAEADNEDQRVTAVCIGINIGSCRTVQQSTSTRPTGDVGGGNPWPGVLLVVAIMCPVVFVAALTWRRSEEW